MLAGLCSKELLSPLVTRDWMARWWVSIFCGPFHKMALSAIFQTIVPGLGSGRGAGCLVSSAVRTVRLSGP